MTKELGSPITDRNLFRDQVRFGKKLEAQVGTLMSRPKDPIIRPNSILRETTKR